MAADRSFPAMGSDAHIIVVAGPDGPADPALLDMAVRRVDDLERRWSRFLPGSEVNRLNDHAGTFVEVSPETVILVERALEAWRLSGGAFDPTVLGAVVRAGYDRSFEQLGPTPPPGRSPLKLGAGEITVDGTWVCLAAGTGFDPGGIGKGLAADMVCAEVLAAGAAGACINLGGDVRVAGRGPEGAGWTVSVEHPWSDTPIALAGLSDGALATSTTLRRRWLSGGSGGRGGELRHHLIDPRTGQPSDTDVTLAAVIGARAWVAEVLAKAVLLAGSRHPFDIVGGTGAEALVVDDHGAVRATPGFAGYLGGRAAAAELRLAARVPPTPMK